MIASLLAGWVVLLSAAFLADRFNWVQNSAIRGILLLAIGILSAATSITAVYLAWKYLP